MNFFDVFALPFGLPGPPNRERSPGELLAVVIAYFVLPLLGFVVVLFAGMWQQPVIAMVGFPIAFAGASVVVCALLNLCGVAFLLGVVGSFFSGF